MSSHSKHALLVAINEARKYTSHVGAGTNEEENDVKELVEIEKCRLRGAFGQLDFFI